MFSFYEKPMSTYKFSLITGLCTFLIVMRRIWTQFSLVIISFSNLLIIFIKLNKSNHNRDGGLDRFLQFHVSVYSLVLVSIEKIYIKHLRQCFITFPNTSNFVMLCIVFSTLFLMFGNVMKHCLSCLIYYLKQFLVFMMKAFSTPSTA